MLKKLINSRRKLLSSLSDQALSALGVNKMVIASVGSASNWLKVFIIIIASVIFMASIAIVSFIMLENLSNPIENADNSAASVYIMPANGDQKVNDNRLKIVQDYLQGLDSITVLNVMPESDVKRILSSWMDRDLDSLFMVPVIIDIQFKNINIFNAEDLQIGLNDKVYDVFVERYVDGIKRLTANTNTLKAVNIIVFAMSFIVIIASTSVASMVLLFANKKYIEVLTLAGSSVSEISRNFSYACALSSIKGVILGFALTSVVLLLVWLVGDIVFISYLVIYAITSIAIGVPICVSLTSFFITQRIVKRTVYWSL